MKEPPFTLSWNWLDLVINLLILFGVSVGSYHYRRLAFRAERVFHRETKLVHVAESLSLGMYALPTVNLVAILLRIVLVRGTAGLTPDESFFLVSLIMAAWATGAGSRATIHCAVTVDKIDLLRTLLRTRAPLIPAAVDYAWPGPTRTGAYLLVLLVLCADFALITLTYAPRIRPFLTL